MGWSTVYKYESTTSSRVFSGTYDIVVNEKDNDEEDEYVNEDYFEGTATEISEAMVPPMHVKSILKT